MNPTTSITLKHTLTKPRSRGDEPSFHVAALCTCIKTPLTRG